jgi:L-fucose isomerase and related proteins
MNNKTIGLITNMSLDKSWSDEILKRVSDSHGRVKDILTKLGYKVLDTGNLTREYKDMEAAGRRLRAEGIRALVIYIGTWTYANACVAAAREAGVPVVIYGDGETGSCGLVGAAIATGGLAEYGIYTNLVYGRFDDLRTSRELDFYLNSACAAKSLDGSILGVGGGRSMGMVTAVCDPNKVKRQFGVEIDSFEQSEIIARAEVYPQKEITFFYNWIKNTFGKIIASDTVMEKQIALYLALRDFCAEKNYDFVSMKCLPELPSVYTTFCLAHAIMGDGTDAYGPKDRVVFACEADINAALTMQLMSNLTCKAVMFTDLTQYDFDCDLLTTCNCGSQPTEFASSPKDVWWEKEGVHEFKWKYGGCCPQHVGKSGNVTMARLYTVLGEYRMMITRAEAVEMPREKLNETIRERPHTYFRFAYDKIKFFSAIRSNHIHVVYGDYTAELAEACKVLGVGIDIIE